VLAHPATRRGEGWSGSADILTPSPARVSPPCPHFGVCGGCALQHWRDDEYATWKAALLEAALRRAGYGETTIAPLVRTKPRTRRRVDLAILRHGAELAVGLHAARDSAISDIAGCSVLHPALMALLDPLRAALRGLSALKRTGSAVINLLENGPDLLLRLDGEANAADRTRLSAFAAAHGLARISLARRDGVPETACLLRPPMVRFAGIAVMPPPGAFLQASREGEAAITEAVLAGLPEKLPPRARIGELYAGCGTLTFALARQARVAAFEGDGPTAAALTAAVNTAGLAGRIEVRRRDLTRQPVAAKELAGFAAVVLDPPQTGAVVQIGEIAASGVARVIYVSCNPAALARDARLLLGAGYDLMAATPVDQFVWSSRLESVSVFARRQGGEARARRTRPPTGITRFAYG
jgi:23S rRNA (uracil1939-C5)-methyltransferase